MSRRATKLRLLPAPSAPARPRLTYQWERFSAIIRELLPLFDLHWQEIAVNKKAIKLDPNIGLYCQYEAAGILHVLTARSEGVLVGYVFCCVGPHLHYASTRFCQIDMYWLDPAHRSGWNGVRLFQAMEHRMRELEVKIIMGGEKLHFHNKNKRRAERLFRFLGYKADARYYSKMIG